MSKKYHINPETGRPNQCTATFRDCKYSVDGKMPEHYDSKETAIAAFETSMEDFLIPPNAKTVSNKFSRKRIQLEDSILNEEENQKLIQNMYNEHSLMMEKLDRAETHAVKFYSFTGSSMINRTLHGVPREDEVYDDGGKNSIKNHIHRLDKVISENETRGNTRKLYRYITVPDGQNTDEYAQSIVDKGEYSDTGYMSTTEDLSFIAAYASKHKHRKFVVLEIETDRGISLQSENEESEGHLQSFEKERLLPRDMSFEVQDSGKASIKVDDSRETLRKEFAGWDWEDWYSGSKTIYDIPKKSFSVIKLRDKNLTADK